MSGKSDVGRKDRIAYMIRMMEKANGLPVDKETIEDLQELPDEELPYIPGTIIGPESQLFSCAGCANVEYFSWTLPVCPHCGDVDSYFHKL